MEKRERERQEPIELRRARAKRAGGDARGALRVIDEYLAREPRDAPALFEKSRILYELGDRPASLETRLKALDLKKASTDVAAIAEMLMEDGLYGEAEIVLRTRLSADDKQFTTRFTLAKLLLFSGRYIEAETEIKKLYRVSKKTPIVRADYLHALRLALLGDAPNLLALVERLRANNVPKYRLIFFEALNDFIFAGDADRFASSLARLRREARAFPLYESLFKEITPDLFLGAENRARRDFRRMLGDRIKGPTLAGASFNEEESTILSEIFSRHSAVRFLPIDEESSGFSGDRVLRAHPESKGFNERSNLIKLGPKYRVAIEREKMTQFVIGKLHSTFHPQILDYANGRTMAAMRLSWAAVDDEAALSLRRLILDPAHGVDEISGILDRLVRKAFAGWYLRNTKARAVRIWQHLRTYADAFEEYTGKSEAATALRSLCDRRISEKMMIPYGLHHGDLNARNVLVDAEGNICVIDFYKSGWGFSFLDLARMEVDVRYEAGDTMDEYIEECRWLNERLAGSTTLAEIRDLDVRRSMEKRLAATWKLRSLAAELFGFDEQETLQLYSIALLISLIRLMKYHHLSEARAQLLMDEVSILVKNLEFAGD